MWYNIQYYIMSKVDNSDNTRYGGKYKCHFKI